MIKIIKVGDVAYEATLEGTYSLEDRFIFQIKKDNNYEFITGTWEEVFDRPVRLIWKIVGIVKED
jgi:hypothetical protein